MKGLLWFLTAVWFLGSWYWYVCPHKQVCPWFKDKGGAHVENVIGEDKSPAEKTYGPLTFAWSNPQAFTTAGFHALRDSITNQLENRDKLEITGRYYSEEENNSGLEDLGLARAAALRDSFALIMPKRRIEIKSQLIEGPSSDARTDRFGAASFRRMLSNKSVREVEGKMVINFPHASADMLSNQELIKYLDEVVARLNETEEKINLVGHTDSSAGAARNMRLGMLRAEAIKKILVDKGLDPSRISTSSKGEAQPIASNSTQAGMQENRRVELTIID